MSITEKLASSLGRKDEAPNIELAEIIALRSDKSAVDELIENLYSKNKDIQNDSIKVLYEIGERKAELIGEYADEFLSLFQSKNNRLQWGAMTALDKITSVAPDKIYSNIEKIMLAAESGSVITKDHAVEILIKLCSDKKYSDKAFPFLMKELKKSLPNQLAMYAERSMPVIDKKHKDEFVKVLKMRVKDIEKDSKKKRIEKIIKRFS